MCRPNKNPEEMGKFLQHLKVGPRNRSLRYLSPSDSCDQKYFQWKWLINRIRIIGKYLQTRVRGSTEHKRQVTCFHTYADSKLAQATSKLRIQATKFSFSHPWPGVRSHAERHLNPRKLQILAQTQENWDETPKMSSRINHWIRCCWRKTRLLWFFTQQ